MDDDDLSFQCQQNGGLVSTRRYRFPSIADKNYFPVVLKGKTLVFTGPHPKVSLQFFSRFFHYPRLHS